MTLEDLEALRAAIPDDGALPASTTSDERAAMQRRRADLDRRLMRARDATATLAALATDDADAQWRDRLEAWRRVLCDELLALPPRIRDAPTLGVQQNVTLSIRAIDFGLRVLENTGYGLTNLRLGELMAGDGYEHIGADPERNYAGEMPWHGCLKEVEHRINDRERRRAAAQAQLDEAFMDDDVRARRDAEADRRRAELNARPVRKTRGDGSQYDKWPDGRRVEIS
jgi:hypothetical protein